MFGLSQTQDPQDKALFSDRTKWYGQNGTDKIIWTKGSRTKW